MSDIHEPRFIQGKKTRHLVMSMDYFLQNQSEINKLLDAYQFDSEREVTRIDSEEENLVEFIQSYNGEDDDSFEGYFEGSGEETHH